MSLGLSLSTAFFENASTGMVLGMCLGMAIGSAIGTKRKKELENEQGQ